MSGRAEVGECAYCHAPLLADDAVDETGTMHAEPCSGEERAAHEDRIVDHARDREMLREEDGR